MTLLQDEQQTSRKSRAGMVLSWRHQASKAKPHIAELWLGVGWAHVAAA